MMQSSYSLIAKAIDSNHCDIVFSRDLSECLTKIKCLVSNEECDYVPREMVIISPYIHARALGDLIEAFSELFRQPSRVILITLDKTARGIRSKLSIKELEIRTLEHLHAKMMIFLFDCKEGSQLLVVTIGSANVTNYAYSSHEAALIMGVKIRYSTKIKSFQQLEVRNLVAPLNEIISYVLTLYWRSNPI